MAEITDINSSGASAERITVRGEPMQVLLNDAGGNWNGATVSLEVLQGGSWFPVRQYTDNAYDIVETVDTAVYRFNTSGTPTINCFVTFGRSGSSAVQ